MSAVLIKKGGVWVQRASGPMTVAGFGLVLIPTITILRHASLELQAQGVEFDAGIGDLDLTLNRIPDEPPAIYTSSWIPTRARTRSLQIITTTTRPFWLNSNSVDSMSRRVAAVTTASPRPLWLLR
jgi:hypothetical protein